MPEHAGEHRQGLSEPRRETPGPRTQSGAEVTRRAFLRTAVASGAALAGSLTVPSVITRARGAEKSVKIGIWAGPDGELIKSTIVKRFEEKYRVKVLIDEGITTEQLARMRASKNNPTHTVMFMDDIGVTVAHR
nr:hypothetical protein [Candidatus Tectomicrobia bacterium]